MKFLAEDDALTIKLEGMEMLWGFRHKLVIPRDNITSLSWTPQFMYDGERLWRLGGTGAPGLLYAGNFKASDGRYFMYVQRPKGWSSSGRVTADNILDIHITDFRYQRVLLTCQPDIGASLMNWFKGTR